MIQTVAIRDTEYHTFGFLEPFLPTSVYDILSPQVITLPPQSILVPGLAGTRYITMTFRILKAR